MLAIDLTSKNVIVACHDGEDLHLWSFPWNVVFRQNGNDISISIGENEEIVDDNCVIINNLRDKFHLIHDRTMQTEIMSALISHISNIVGQEHIEKDSKTCVIVPYGYSSSILDVVESGFEQSSLTLLNFINECVSTIIYFFENSKRFAELNPNPSGESFCFINTTTLPARAFIVDYHQKENDLSFFVRDYFITPELYDGSEFPKVLIPGLKTVIFGDPKLVNPVGKVVFTLEHQDKCKVMSVGAIILGLGRLKAKRTYSISGCMSFGIQIDDEVFYEIISKELLFSKLKLPIKKNKAFLIDNVSYDVNINLFCGFSNKLISALNLETITLMESWFTEGKTEIVVSIELESMHNGKFSVYNRSGKFTQITKNFNVPGWLG